MPLVSGQAFTYSSGGLCKKLRDVCEMLAITYRGLEDTITCAMVTQDSLLHACRIESSSRDLQPREGRDRATTCS